MKRYPKNKQPIQQELKFKTPNCPSCKQNNWLDFDKGHYCKNCEFINNKQKHQIDKKTRRQDNDFSTRLPYAKKKIREIWINLVNSTEAMTNKLVEKKGKQN